MRALIDSVDALYVLVHRDEYSEAVIAEAQEFMRTEPARRAREAKHNLRSAPIRWSMVDLEHGGVDARLDRRGAA